MIIFTNNYIDEKMYWDNSIFLTNKQKEKLEREVDYICNEVKNIMLDNGLCVSLYLSG